MATPIVIGSMCAGDVRCYAAMVHARHVVIDATERHLPLRHSHHRYLIDGPNGIVKLTVPLDGASNAIPVMMKDVLLSEHGNWRHLHWGALFSSYGKSPFFDFIAHDLHAIIAQGSQTHLLELNMQLHQLVVDFMDLPITTTVAHNEEELIHATGNNHVIDLRCKIGGKRADNMPISSVPYYQLWSNRHDGFTPSLSILDLLMNEGREGIFTLLEMASAMR